MKKQPITEELVLEINEQAKAAEKDGTFSKFKAEVDLLYSQEERNKMKMLMFNMMNDGKLSLEDLKNK